MLGDDEQTPNARSPKSHTDPNSALAKVNKKRKPNELGGQQSHAGNGSSNQDGQLTFGQKMTSEAGQIQDLIQSLRQRVLEGENMTNFKKDIGTIATLIDKCD